jgi:hypothetical protein
VHTTILFYCVSSLHQILHYHFEVKFSYVFDSHFEFRDITQILTVTHESKEEYYALFYYH